MNYTSVSEVMRVLGIKNWGKLGQGQVLRLLEIMLLLDKEIVLKIIDQLPEFATFTSDAFNSLRESVKNLSATNNEDSSEYLALINQTQATLERELDKENLDREDKKYIINQMMELTERVRTMDQNNQEFKKNETQKKVKGLGIFAAGALVVTGFTWLIRNSNIK